MQDAQAAWRVTQRGRAELGGVLFGASSAGEDGVEPSIADGQGERARMAAKNKKPLIDVRGSSF